MNYLFTFFRFLQIKYNLNVLLDIKSGINSNYGVNPEGTIFTLDKFKTKIKVANDKNCYLGLFGKKKISDKSVFSKVVIYKKKIIKLIYIVINSNIELIISKDIFKT